MFVVRGRWYLNTVHVEWKVWVYASLAWYEKAFRFTGVKVDMPFIGLIWDLIIIALESNCSVVRIFNNKIHTGFICKAVNIWANVRDNIIDKHQEKQCPQDWSLWHTRGQDLPLGARTRQKNTLLPLVKLVLNHKNSSPETHVDLSLYRRPLCHTRSNALLISKNTDLTSYPSPRALHCTRKRVG